MPLGNLSGIVMNDTDNNTIGGTASGAGDVIAGNDAAGFDTAGSQIVIGGGAGTLVEGNFDRPGRDGLALPGATYTACLSTTHRASPSAARRPPCAT